MVDEYKVVCALSNSVIFDDLKRGGTLAACLGWHGIYISAESIYAHCYVSCKADCGLLALSFQKAA